MSKAAFIGIKGAAESEYDRLNRPFKESVFDIEVTLLPNEDPVSANRAYRDLRNLRVHFAIPLVTLEHRSLLFDLARGEEHRPGPRWYFRPVEWDLVKRLRTPQLRELDVRRFNTYIEKRPIIDVMGQVLLVARAVLDEGARELG